MSFFDSPKPKTPAKAPWPPGVDFRFVWLNNRDGVVAQVRPGAVLTEEQYKATVWAPGARYRERIGSPCLLN